MPTACLSNFSAALSFAFCAVHHLFAGIQALSDRIVGGLMLLVASGVFFYYTIWAFIMVSTTWAEFRA